MSSTQVFKQNKYLDTACMVQWDNHCNYVGVFQPLEKFSTVRLIVSEVLNNPAHKFTLSAYGKVIADEDIPLAQLGLVGRLCTDNG